MIELNLLPRELRKKKKRQMPDIKPVPILVGVAGVLVLVHILLALLVINNGILLKTLKKKWERMKPQKEMTDRIARETSELEKRVTAVRALAKPDLSWTTLLSGLNQAMIPNVWLSDLRLSFGGRAYSIRKEGQVPTQLNLTGYALGKSEEATSAVARFINSLKRNKIFFDYFKDVELQNMRSSTVAGEEVMNFNLKCDFKKPEEKSETAVKSRKK
ncbi:MAG: PilN domain-containing protein [Candidatus Omnitrophota bacterium]|nr:PilN domain-containing protein [Candidatus Omnitrophota bacterium]